ncbi:MAG: hypothetical protein FWD93_05225, partial [Coriobacteriia bacterium]|nr:hypothetical protein [Coriobacteriia bacterium]
MSAGSTNNNSTSQILPNKVVSGSSNLLRLGTVRDTVGKSSLLHKVALVTVAFFCLALPLAATATVEVLQNPLDQTQEALGSSGSEELTLRWLLPDTDQAHLTLDPTNELQWGANQRQSLIFELNFAPEGDETFAAGEIEIRLPRALFENRAGNLITGNIPTNDGPAPQNAPAMFIPLPADTSFDVVETTATEVVIRNFRPTQMSTEPLRIMFEVHYLPSQSPNGFSNEFSATASLGTVREIESNSLGFDLITRTTPGPTTKSVVGSSGAWQGTWGAEPPNSTNYFFVRYRLHATTRSNNPVLWPTQPSVVQTTEEPLDGGQIVAFSSNVDFHTGVNAAIHTFTRGSTADFNNLARNANWALATPRGGNAIGMVHYQDIIVAYPRTGEAEQTVRNRVTVVHTPLDNDRDPIANPVVTQQAEASYTFINEEPEGNLFRTRKQMTSVPSWNNLRHNILDWLEAGLSPRLNYAADAGGNFGTLGTFFNGDVLSREFMEAIFVQARAFHATEGGTRPFTTTVIDDHVFLRTPTGVHLLNPEDYRFDRVRIANLRETVPITNSAGDFLGAQILPNASRSDVRLYYMTPASSNWQHFTTYSPTAALDGPWINLPDDDIYRIKAVHENGRYAVEFVITFNIVLNPTANVLDLIEGRETVVLHNASAMIVEDYDGILLNAAEENDYLPAWPPGLADMDLVDYESYVMRSVTTSTLGRANPSSNFQKGMRATPINDAQNARIVIPYRMWGQVTISRDSGQDHIPESFLAALLTEHTESVFYDLLPQGMIIDPGSINARDARGRVADHRLEITENWQGSGRTLVSIYVNAISSMNFSNTQGTLTGNFPAANPAIFGTGFRVDFDAFYPWDAVSLFGVDTRNLASYQSRNGALQGSSVQSGGQPHSNSDNTATAFTVAERLLMQNFPDTDMLDQNERNTRSAGFNFTVHPITADQMGFSKLVRASTDTEYLTDTSVRPGGSYQYRLRYATPTAGGDTSRVVIYDVLEQGHGPNQHWRGILTDIDYSHPRSLGIGVVIYYSTVSGLNPQGNAAHANLANAAIWSTTAPTDRSTITAVA